MILPTSPTDMKEVSILLDNGDQKMFQAVLYILGGVLKS